MVDHVLRRRKAHLLQLVGRGLERVDLAGGELVAADSSQYGVAVLERVEGETLRSTVDCQSGRGFSVRRRIIRPSAFAAVAA